MITTRVTTAFLLLGLAACSGDASVQEAAATTPSPSAGPERVSAEVYERHIARLASDEFEGRKPATPGEQKTLDYLSQEFRNVGLKPAQGTSYLQSVPLVEITTAGDARLTFDGAPGLPAMEYPRNTVLFSKRLVPQVNVQKSPLVFVGYGVVAPELGWNDYAGLDMKGKTAVILINDPGFATGDESLFRGRALTYYGRWTYKFEEAARQGAAGALIVHETEPAAYGWEIVQNSWTGPQLDMASATGNEQRVQFEGWIDLPSAQKLFAAAGKDFETLKAAANRRGFKPIDMGVTASVSLSNTVRHSNSANVVGVIPGTKRPGEYIVYMAHWDHLGRAAGGTGDRIFNGAEDNATGTSGLLTIADAFRRSKTRPERSIVFLAVTAEESGLLGSAHYTANPIFPLAQTVAAINMDAMYFGGPTHDVRVVGYGASELDRYLAEAARTQKRRIEPEPTPEKGFFYRSDQFNFAKHGVPSLYVKLGIEDRERGADFGRKQQDEYIAQRYHKPADEYRPGVDLRGSLEDLQLLYQVGAKLAGEASFPQWSKESEFRAARERSRAIMK
jgi:Zn-dependent M28 family amino/carboxypeptidase